MGARRSILGVGAVAAAAVLIAIVAGCGSGGSSNLSKAEFTSQAKAICNEWQSQREESVNKAMAQLSHGKVTRADQEKAVFAVLSPYEETIQKLEGLSPPKGEEKQVEAFTAAMNEAVERTKTDPGSALTSTVPFKKANELLTKYGLADCEA